MIIEKPIEYETPEWVKNFSEWITTDWDQQDHCNEPELSSRPAMEHKTDIPFN